VSAAQIGYLFGVFLISLFVGLVAIMIPIAIPALTERAVSALTVLFIRVLPGKRQNNPTASV
jgi:hypothetical protein